MLRQLPIDRLEPYRDAETGLSAGEVARRRARYGTNDILEAPAGGWRDVVRDTLRDPMLWFLIATSILFAAVGELKEALTLAVALVPLAGMDLWLHRRTQASTATLGGRLTTRAHVLRDGEVIDLAATDLVPGDLVMLAAGEAFPADGIIVRSEAAQVDESALTGEAFPVRKQYCEPGTFAGELVPVDASHWGYAGTRLLAGSARLRVVFTGAETFYGEIVRSAVQGSHARTPLQRAIADLVRVLLVAAVILCLTVAWVRWVQGYGLLDAVISAVTLAVAALPEEFPVVFTFFLGVGVYRLARQQALVRRAVAVENIGRVTAICSDKTGTITLGRLVLTHVHPAGDTTPEELLQVAAAASRADSGDPLDRAILEHADTPRTRLHRLFTFPFTEDRKRESAILRLEDGRLLAVTKGAHETVIPQCRLEATERRHWVSLAEQLASGGHKVIACAQRVLDESNEEQAEPESGLVFAGLLALEDPVREGVKESVRVCRDAGIHVIMITGDHPLTARAVAKEVGLGGGDPRVVTADEIAGHDEPHVDLREVDVIARSMPSQKLQFVRQMQAAGEIVAVTGDGVNDVPALQAADIGVAMGERGTQAAREVAAVVLIDDNFRTIVRAITEGNQLFANLHMSFAYLLMIHFPLVLSAAVIPLAGYPLLYLPVHIVWMELIIHPTALLVYQQLPRHGMVHRRTLRGSTRFFDRGEWMLIGLVGVVFTVVLVGGYVYSLGAGREVEHGRAMALAVLSFGSAGITVSLSRLKTWTARIVAALTAVSAVVLIQQPFLAEALHLMPLHWDDWGLVAAGAGLVAAIAMALRMRR